MNQIYICMHCRLDLIIDVADPEEMLLVKCQCGGYHHLRQGILTQACEPIPVKFDVRADQPTAEQT